MYNKYVLVVCILSFFSSIIFALVFGNYIAAITFFALGVYWLDGWVKKKKK